jgi:hypothetical protein
MEPSPAPHESPAKGADKETEPGSLARFRSLASRLFGVDRTEFQKAFAKDEAERLRGRIGKPVKHKPVEKSE